MERLNDIFSAIKDFLSYQIYDSDSIHINVGTLLAIIIALFAVSLILKLIYRLATAKLPEVDKNKFVSIFNFFRYLLYILAIVTVLHASGVNLTVLLTASAALFVGLGFALQYLFQDIISGMLIILDQSLHVGDVIEVDDKVSRVFEIRLRTTRVLTRDDKVIIIPNHVFLTDSIYNYTQNHNITRESVKVGVAYGSDVSKVTKILEDVADNHKDVLKSPKAFVQFDDFGDSALMFSLNFYITNSFRDPGIKSEMRYAIDAEFRNNGISIPFPQRDVHVYQHSPFEHSKVENSKPQWGLGDD